MGQLLQFIPAGGQVCACNRRGEVVKVADARNKEARFLRLATEAQGLCAECAVAEFFFVIEMRSLVPDPKALLLPHVQEQMQAVMKAGNSDMTGKKIDWEKVVKNWHLPFAMGKKRIDPNGPVPTLGRRRRSKKQ